MSVGVTRISKLTGIMSPAGLSDECGSVAHDIFTVYTVQGNAWVSLASSDVGEPVQSASAICQCNVPVRMCLPAGAPGGTGGGTQTCKHDVGAIA